MNPDDVIRQARKEVQEEEFRKAVEKEKARIRAHVPWYKRLRNWFRARLEAPFNI